MYTFITLVSVNQNIIYKNECIKENSLGKIFNETHLLDPNGGKKHGNREKEQRYLEIYNQS